MKLYVIYRISTKKNLIATNEFNQALELIGLFNEQDGIKPTEKSNYSIKVLNIQ